ncbi:hypothetical protein KCTC32420_01343 [Aequorivita nionensis]
MESNSDKIKIAKTLLCKQIGATIKEIRKEKNIQQLDLAAACNFEKLNMASPIIKLKMFNIINNKIALSCKTLLIEIKKPL